MSTETIYFKSYGSCGIKCEKRMRAYFVCPLLFVPLVGYVPSDDGAGVVVEVI